jgi:hypothetical protein
VENFWLKLNVAYNGREGNKVNTVFLEEKNCILRPPYGSICRAKVTESTHLILASSLRLMISV